MLSDQSLASVQKLLHDDVDFARSRNAPAAVSKPGQLTRTEKLRLGDLLDAYVEMPGQDLKGSTPAEIYKEFYGHIFKSWVSTQTTNLRTALPPRPTHQTRIELGTPQTGGTSQGTRRSYDEMMYGPVFLNMAFDPEEETFAWTWYDGDNNIIKRKNLEVRLPRGTAIKIAKRTAIENYDDIERERITSHNRTQIIGAARRRISKWAQIGPDSRGHIDDEDKLKDGEILPLRLASDVWLKTSRDDADIATSIQSRRVGTAHH
ncbi:hypothetical protein CEP53_010030 [Fusarium sp. AF-6]|nr:hypothetical protein CEP53_010030 [Fusarium sp. AF-6]